MTDHVGYMKRALELAERGRGLTSPNPMVGAVIVKGRRVVGEGFYTYRRKKHAEVLALEEAGRRAGGGTLYVNLEPCCHHGRTPPCTEALVRAGVGRVVAAMKDPDVRVGGKGIESLRASGVEVTLDLLSKEAKELNKAYIKQKRTGLPYVLIKSGMSLDGRIAASSGRSKWITSGESLRHYRRLRAYHDAVMVGVETVVKDDPLLDPRGRGIPKRRIRKVILDSNLRIPEGARVLARSSDLSVYTLKGRGGAEKIEKLRSLGVTVKEMEGKGRPDIIAVLEDLGSEGIQSLIVEGGGKVAGSVVGAGAADGLLLYVAPSLLGGVESVPLLDWSCGPDLAGRVRIGNLEVEKLGRDIMITGEIEKGRRRCSRG